MTNRKKHRSAWKEEELDFIRQNYKTLSTGEIASHLKRPRYGVYQKMRSIGCYIAPEKKAKNE